MMRATMILGLMLMAAAGCGGEDSKQIALDGPIALRVDGAAVGMARVRLDGATAIVTPSGPVIARVGGGASSELTFAPPTMALALERRDAGRAQLADLRLPLGDVRVFARAIPDGLQLRDLALELPERTALDVVRASDTVLTLAARAPLALDWKLQLEDGTLYPLGKLPIGPVDLRLAVTRDDAGALDVQLVAMCPESCGGVDEVFELADGMVWTHAAAVAR